MKRLILLFIVLTSLVNAQSTRQDVSKVGTTAAKFLSIPAGTRALAFGGAFASVADDPSAMYWNPSGIARLTGNQIMFDHGNWLVGMSYNYAGVVLPFGTVGTLGLNVTAFSSGEMDVTTEDFPEGTGETFSGTSYAFGVTYAKNLTDWFSIGANVKYITEKIWHSSASGVGVDIGTLFNTPFYGVRFGASINNFGSKMQIGGDDLLTQVDINPAISGNDPNTNSYLATDKFDLPLNLRIGISKDFISTPDQVLTLAVDAVHPNDNTENIDVGAEYQLFNRMIAFRGGYKSLFRRDNQEQFTVGAGLNQRFENLSLSFDYGYLAFERFAGVHKFALTIGF